MQTSVVGQEVTMIQAIAECYEFNPRKKKGSVICFEVSFPNEEKTLKFGKNWSRLEHKWQYFTEDTYCPALQSEEKHFISNIFARSGVQRCMTYSAQQGRYKVVRIM